MHLPSVVVAGLLAGIGLTSCALDVDEPDTSDVRSNVVSQQGKDLQGKDFQGTTYQGQDFSGTSFVSASPSGATQNGRPLTSVGILGTQLIAWRQNADTTWTKLYPDHSCLYDASRRLLSCSNATRGMSPLNGSIWPATFAHTNADGTRTLFQVQLQIGLAANTLNTAMSDTNAAMFALDGSSASSCGLVPQGQPLPQGGGVCEAPGGCRVNCDVWLYDVRIVGATDPATGNLAQMCQSGQAMVLTGTWDQTGTYTPGHFTFACTSGTISKCTRWGYRPYSNAIDSGGTSKPLADYHQTCVRAAMADYCANGTSYTLDGTLVDISDVTAASPGFIFPHVGGTAFAPESKFDNLGATEIQQTRYSFIPGIDTPNYLCPGHFAASPGTGKWTRVKDPGPVGPVISISSAPSCSHSEQTVGRFLSASCNVACSNRMVTDYSDCFKSSPNGDTAWTKACVDAAAVCSGKTMAPHSECQQGVGLPMYSSQCTLLVDMKQPSCATNWDGTCVGLAVSLCTGGLGTVPWIDFCGHPIQIESL